MSEYTLLQWMEQIGGIVLVLIVLVDVFLLILHARASIGVLSRAISQVTWRFFLWMSKAFGRKRQSVLSLCGPVILLVLLLAWAFLISLGTGLIIHPNLGTAIRSNSGETPTDFITAMYVSGTSLSVVGGSDFSPHSSVFRLFFLLTSFIGVLVTTLALTYLLEVYNALQRRNALGLMIHLLTAQRSDAALLLAGIGPQGKFDVGYNSLTELAAEVISVQEAHHLYPLLFYFRFREAYYSVSHMALITLDAASLIESALDEAQYGWLKQSASVSQIWRGSLMLITTLTSEFLPGATQPAEKPPDAETINRWRRRYCAALGQLQQAGIQTTTDEQAGVDKYVSLRREWDGYITTLAPMLAYEMDKIDPVGSQV